MPRNYWASEIPGFSIADGTALTTTTLTDISPSPQKVTPANFAGEYGGAIFKVEAAGFYTLGATASNVTIGLYTGTIGQAIGAGVAVAITSAVAQVTSSTNRPWRIEGLVQIRTVGATGTAVGFLEVGNVTSGGRDYATTAAGGTATVDTTVARWWGIGATLSSATGNSVTCRVLEIMSVN